MKKIVRSLLYTKSLFIFRWAWVARVMSFFCYQHRRVTRSRLEAQLRARGLYGDLVVSGPFRDLRYPPPEQWASCRFEKINATYEHELHALINRLVASKQYKTIVNVGAAEGFYSVGLAKLFPTAQVISYEGQKAHDIFCADLARLNGVSDRIDSRGFCHVEDLAALKLDGKVLVWMDIDTGERQVLDPVKIPWLKDADILVELHDCLEPGLTPLIRDRFSPSHQIEQITNSGLDYGRYPILRDLLFTEIEALVGEDRRGLQDWFFMEPSQTK